MLAAKPTRRRPIVEALAVLALMAASGWIGYAFADWQKPAARYPLLRAEALVMQASQFGHADTLVLGDSLVERTDLTGACGITFNAGMGGASAAEVLPVAKPLFDMLEPDLVVIALGTNYFVAGDRSDRQSREMPALVDALPAETPLVLVGIRNSRSGNRAIRDLANERGAIFVEAPEGPLAADGVHYTRDGAVAYRTAIARGCERATEKSD